MIQETILQTIAEIGPCERDSIVKRTDKPRTTVYDHIRKLMVDEKVKRGILITPRGRPITLFFTEGQTGNYLKCDKCKHSVFAENEETMMRHIRDDHMPKPRKRQRIDDIVDFLRDNGNYAYTVQEICDAVHMGYSFCLDLLRENTDVIKYDIEINPKTYSNGRVHNLKTKYYSLR